MKRLGSALVLLFLGLAAAAAANAGGNTSFSQAVSSILAQPYQPNYAPVGLDSAFAPDTVANTFPAQDYTSGSVPGDPDHPNWPAAFGPPLLLHSSDSAPFFARLA